jgi:hypothetical protein
MGFFYYCIIQNAPAVHVSWPHSNEGATMSRLVFLVETK